jgi:hypothetical protein
MAWSLRGGTCDGREFITFLGGAAAAWPFAARAQQAAVPVIGFLNAASPVPYAHLVRAFRKPSTKPATSKGQNVTVEYHWLEGQYDRLRAGGRSGPPTGGTPASIAVGCRRRPSLYALRLAFVIP